MNLEWLKAQISVKRISQAEIAEILGVTQGTVSKLVNGRQVLKAHEADAIRRYLGYTLPEDLQEGTPEKIILEGLSNLDEEGKRSLAYFLERLAGRPDQSLRA